jgi:DedD protein
MNPILLRRLLGAGVLLLLLFVLSLLLPAPSDPKPAEPGMRRIEVAVDDPKPIELPKPSAPAAGVSSESQPRQSPRPSQSDETAPDPRFARSESATVGGVRLSADAAVSPDVASSSPQEDDDAAAAPSADTAPVEPEQKPEPKPRPEPKPQPPSAVATKPKLQTPLPKAAGKPVEQKPAAPTPQAPAVAAAEKPQAAAASKPAPAAAPQRWAVQAGSYADIGNARQVEAQLKSMGLSSSISLTEAGGSARYRVRSGPYATREAAEAARLRMQQNRITASVVADGA